MIEVEFLSKIIIIIGIGFLIAYISKIFRLPTAILLIVTGFILNNIYINNQQLFYLSPNFLLSILILVLIFVVFNSLSQFSYHELDTYSELAFKLALFFIIMNIMFLGVFTHLFFNITNVVVCFIFALVVSSTDFTLFFPLIKNKENRIMEILKYETLIATPIIILLVIMLLNFIKFEDKILIDFFSSAYPFLLEIALGFGIGLLVALIVFRALRNFHVAWLSNISLLFFMLLSYFTAELLNANGIFAVAAYSLLFERVTFRKKKEMQTFSKYLSSILENIILILLGFVLPLRFEPKFILYSFILFVIMILIRFFSLFLSLSHHDINIKEMIFISFTSPKGVAVAALALILFNNSIGFPNIIIDLIFIFILYSIILSSFSAYFLQKLVRKKVEE